MYVNASTGNLVVRQRDEYLAALGTDLALARTYNSQGLYDDDNGDNWRLSVNRRLGIDYGNSVTKTFGDGSAVEFSYDAGADEYRSTAGEGARDVIRQVSPDEWVWHSGDGRVTETYNAAGQLQHLEDRDGNRTSFSYDASGRLERIELAQRQSTDPEQTVHFTYNAGNLESITTDSVQSRTRVTYAYDDSNRLETVAVDLTAAVGGDIRRFVTTYRYDEADRLTGIGHTDGSAVRIEYYGADESPQPEGVVKAITDTAGQRTEYRYDTAAGVTTVTDPLGRQTLYHHGSEGRLTRLESPALPDGGSRLVTEYVYDPAGNIDKVVDPTGAIVDFDYDAQGNLTRQTDAAGNVVEYTWGFGLCCLASDW